MRGRPRKAADRAVGHREHPTVTISTLPARTTARTEVIALRPPPAGLLKQTQERWKAFWRSPYSRVVDYDRDGRAIERLFWLYDERDRLAKSVRKKRFVAGSQGQPTLNPLMPQMRSIDSEIRQLESLFGMNPRSAAQLGITLGDLQKTLEDLNREANDGDSDSETEEVDPRTIRQA